MNGVTVAQEDLGEDPKWVRWPSSVIGKGFGEKKSLNLPPRERSHLLPMDKENLSPPRPNFQTFWEPLGKTILKETRKV